MSFHDVNAAAYLQFAKLLPSLNRSLLKQHIVPLKNRYKKMLDLGCGTGQTTLIFADFFKADSVLGIDRNEDFINVARNHDPSSNCHVYEVCDLNTEHVRGILKDHTEIDLVTSSCCLHWLDDPLRIFTILYSSLRGPIEHVHIIIYSIYEPIYGVLDNLVESPRWITYLQDFEVPSFMTREQPGIVSRLFGQVFSEQKYGRINEIKTKMAFKLPSHEEDMKFLKLTLPFTNRIPTDQQDEFLEDCWKELLKTCVLEDGGVPWSFDIYLMHAQSL